MSYLPSPTVYFPIFQRLFINGNRIRAGNIGFIFNDGIYHPFRGGAIVDAGIR
jgi:hypothetical protein